MDCFTTYLAFFVLAPQKPSQTNKKCRKYGGSGLILLEMRVGNEKSQFYLGVYESSTKHTLIYFSWIVCAYALRQNNHLNYLKTYEEQSFGTLYEIRIVIVMLHKILHGRTTWPPAGLWTIPTSLSQRKVHTATLIFSIIPPVIRWKTVSIRLLYK